jgi:hypothetical protein
VIDSGAYEQRLVTGTARKLVFVWLYWTPEPPPDLTSVPSPRKAGKKGGKKGVKKEPGIKAEKEVKKEVKAEPKPTPKRSRATSGEVSTAKRNITRLQAKAPGEGPATEEDLQTLAEMLEGAGGVPDDDEVAGH